MDFSIAKSDSFCQVQQLIPGEQLFVMKRPGGVDGLEKKRILSVAQAVRQFTYKVIQCITTGGVEKKPTSGFDDVISVL